MLIRSPTASRTVHFAECDPILCQMYLAFGAKLGWQICTSTDSASCLEALRQQLPQALVLDEEILDSGPEDLFSRIRLQNAGKGALPLLITGQNTRSALAQRMGVPVTRCFQKPFSVDNLFEAIRQVLADL